MRSRRAPRRGLAAGAIVLLLALGTLTLGAEAAITWVSESLVSTRAMPAPVHFEEGAGASNHRYVKRVDFSPDRTSFTMTIQAKAGADLTVRDVIRLTNADDRTHAVGFSATPVTNPHVEAFTWTVANETENLDTLDYLAASPAAAFTLPAGATHRLDLRVDLADGASKQDAHATFDLEVTLP